MTHKPLQPDDLRQMQAWLAPSATVDQDARRRARRGRSASRSAPDVPMGDKTAGSRSTPPEGRTRHRARASRRRTRRRGQARTHGHHTRRADGIDATATRRSRLRAPTWIAPRSCADGRLRSPAAVLGSRGQPPAHSADRWSSSRSEAIPQASASTGQARPSAESRSALGRRADEPVVAQLAGAR